MLCIMPFFPTPHTLHRTPIASLCMFMFERQADISMVEHSLAQELSGDLDRLQGHLAARLSPRMHTASSPPQQIQHLQVRAIVDRGGRFYIVLHLGLFIIHFSAARVPLPFRLAMRSYLIPFPLITFHRITLTRGLTSRIHSRRGSRQRYAVAVFNFSTDVEATFCILREFIPSSYQVHTKSCECVGPPTVYTVCNCVLIL